jgi:DNA-binding HxlR family transcriptional regulator
MNTSHGETFREQGIDRRIVTAIFWFVWWQFKRDAHKKQKLPGSNSGMADDEASTIEGRPAGCPLDPVLNLLALKWLVHIVWFLGRSGDLRFAELQRRLPGNVSAKVLSARLKQLEVLGTVEREDKGTKPPHVVYRLTRYGQSINDLLTGLELRARGLSLSGISLPDETRFIA